MTITVKICGVTTPEIVPNIVKAGASHIGLVFHPRSPRFVTIDQAKEIALQTLSLTGEGGRPLGRPGEGVIDNPAPSPFPSPGDGPLPFPVRERVSVVGLFVDPHDDDLETTLDTVPLDMLQLHGNETPERVAEIKSRYRLPIMKAIKIGTQADLEQIEPYEQVSDWLLFDAPTPPGSNRSGGNGVALDWSLLAGRKWNRPWMLSGGLNPANVAEAIRISNAQAVDVSSGVEGEFGVKNVGLVREFIAATIES